MENMQKIVTAQDVADAVGCSKATVSYYFRAPHVVSKSLSERIRQAVADLGYDPRKVKQFNSQKARKARWEIGVTQKDISEKCGVSVTTVSRVLSGKKDVKEEKRQLVLRIAEELGYVPPCKTPEERKAKTKAEKERKFSLRYAGFKNREEQNAYMEVMRSMGHSNAQISRKVGLTIQTVRRRIGPQPEDMSRDNRIAGMKHHAAENQRRRIYVDTHLVRTYNNLILECGNLRKEASELLTKADELAGEIVKMKPQVEKAKLSTEKPAEMPAEQLQMPLTSAVLQ